MLQLFYFICNSVFILYLENCPFNIKNRQYGRFTMVSINQLLLLLFIWDTFNQKRLSIFSLYILFHCRLIKYFHLLFVSKNTNLIYTNVYNSFHNSKLTDYILFYFFIYFPFIICFSAFWTHAYKFSPPGFSVYFFFFLYFHINAIKEFGI